MTQTDNPGESPAGSDFIRAQVVEDLRSGRFDHVRTRFPPEPNGYLHIGHAKAICHRLRHRRRVRRHAATSASTTPTRSRRTSSTSTRSRRTSAGSASTGRTGSTTPPTTSSSSTTGPSQLIRKGKAYVDDQSAERDPRRTAARSPSPGANSPYRDRSVEENLDLFERMRAGEFPDGARVLRAKIDMASPNINLRDPVMYRILHEPPHHRTGDAWCIYPMYDFAHGQSRLDRGHHPLALHRWSTRTTGRSTTGSSTSWASTARGRSSSRA